MKCAVLVLLAFELVIPNPICAQAPGGTISGFVTDASAARISGAIVIVRTRNLV